MKARLPKGYGRPDPQAMMRQVQKMQDEIRAKQDELEAREYTGTASGEMVTVTMTGKHEVTAIKIKPEAVDPDDLEMLEDLLQNYDGTVFLVSHDRSFLDNVVTSTIAWEGPGQWREYEGKIGRAHV